MRYYRMPYWLWRKTFYPNRGKSTSNGSNNGNNGCSGCGCTPAMLWFMGIMGATDGVVVTALHEEYRSFLPVFIIIEIILISVLISRIYVSPKPLNKEEIALLSKARKKQAEKSRLNFSTEHFEINPDYRQFLSSGGRWDEISVPYNKALAMAAELIRYKRHEWLILILASNTKCRFIWANKGNNNMSCYLSGTFDDIIEKAIQNGCGTIIDFHNHPCTVDFQGALSPSDTDMNTAAKWAEKARAAGLNYICAVGVRGQFSVYYSSFDESIYPKSCTVEYIESQNGLSKSGNRALRRELRINS